MIKNELSGYYVDGGLIRYISNLIEPTNIEIVMILELFRNKKTGKLKLENLAAKNEIEP